MLGSRRRRTRATEDGVARCLARARLWWRGCGGARLWELTKARRLGEVEQMWLQGWALCATLAEALSGEASVASSSAIWGLRRLGLSKSTGWIQSNAVISVKRFPNATDKET